MLLLEFDSYRDQSSDLQAYDPFSLGNVGSYADIVREFLSGYHDSRPVDRLCVAVGDSWIDDYYISNRLSGLVSAVDDQLRAGIMDELGRTNTSDEHHARYKGSSALYDTLCYHDASVANHGATLHHQFIEPLVNKATNLASAQLSARHHRLFWAPLYYPETLLDAFKGKDSLRATTFHYPRAGNIGALAQRLLADIQAAGRCTIVSELTGLESKNGTWLINDAISSNRVASSLAQPQLAQLLGVEQAPLERSSYLIDFIAATGDLSFDVLFNANALSPVFRISNQKRLRDSPGRVQYLSVEYNLNHLTAVDKGLLQLDARLSHLKAFFGHFGVDIDIEAASELQLIDKIVFPTTGNVEHAAANTAALRTTSIVLMGPSIGLTGSSMNDQIVQALQYAEQ